MVPLSLPQNVADDWRTITGDCPPKLGSTEGDQRNAGSFDESFCFLKSLGH